MYMWSDEWVAEDGVAEEMAECVGVPASTYIVPLLGYAVSCFEG